MTTKLAVYNGALREHGSRKLVSLADAVEARYYLDDVYDTVTQECLEEGQWNFAMRAVEISSEAGIEPAFGFSYAFAKPDDLVRIAAISAGDRFTFPLENYSDEIGYWWADVDPLYVKYVSNDTSYGMDLGAWPPSYERFVVLMLAARTCMSITQSETRLDYLNKSARRAKINARSKDAMGQPSPRRPEGSWLQSRYSGSIRKYDRA